MQQVSTNLLYNSHVIIMNNVETFSVVPITIPSIGSKRDKNGIGTTAETLLISVILYLLLIAVRMLKLSL